MTESQADAVRHVDGPLLILAGAGSGKTRVVTCRIAHLIGSGVPPSHILGLTFTNKAADEMRMRLAGMVATDGVWIGTFHRFGSYLLRSHAQLVGLSENFSIFDTADSLRALKSTVDGSDLTVIRYTPAQIAREISNAKSQLIGPDEYARRAGRPLESVVAEIYPLYQQRLLASNAVDFDDLLLFTAKLLYDNPDLRGQLDDRYRYVMVDEYQDTNLAQYRIVRALSVDHPNIAVTGDPDQCIYGWRGANVRNILEFERDYPKAATVVLERNYRSTPEILRAANSLISHNTQRKPKSLFTETAAGHPVRLVNYGDAEEESQEIVRRIAGFIRASKYEPREVAILYRTNALSRNFEHALRDEGIPYQIVNGVEFYKRREVKDLLGYLHLVNNPRNDIAFLRVVNVPARGIGRKTLQRVEDFARNHGLSMLATVESDEFLDSLARRTAKVLGKFRADFEPIRSAATLPVEEVVGLVLSATGYAEQFSHSSTEEDEQRLANIHELVTAARQYDARHPAGPGLDGFLEHASLVNDTDAWESDSNKVTLMTLHSAKGLEFPLVFIVAVEHGILPHQRSSEDLMSLEEERRLLFVGITRAQQELQLSWSTYRDLHGSRRRAIPSDFLRNLPLKEIEMIGLEFRERSSDERSSDLRRDSSRTGSSMAREEDSPVHLTDEYSHEAPEGDDFCQDIPSQDEIAASDEAPSSAEPRPPIVLTAADMFEGAEAGGGQANSHSPDAFSLGMVVNHPDYGPGKLVALSGEGAKRMGTVQFFSGAKSRRFRLAHSPLRPLASP